MTDDNDEKFEHTIVGHGSAPKTPAKPAESAELPPTLAPPTASTPTQVMPPRANAAAATLAGSKSAAETASASFEAQVGEEICGYTIKRKLAEGGMGIVYEGEHAKIGRRGAIKVLRAELCTSDEVVERFYQEARAVNSIRHENIVDIYDFGRDARGRAFFVMEFLDGETLAARIARSPLPWSEAYAILEQTLRALKAAHDKGFVHRDLKPENIWLRPRDDGHVEVKLLDFGIAKLVGGESPKEKLTRTGSIMGTPHYMSPEQINGAKGVDQRTDIYAMGIITYEMFAGATPFVGDTLQAVITGHLFTEPPRLANLPASLSVPTPIAEIVERMLVKNPADRYASVADVLADLRAVYRDQSPTFAESLKAAKPITKIGGTAAPAAPNRTRLYAVLGLIGVLAAGAIVVWQLRGRDKEPARDVGTTPAPARPIPSETPPTPAPVEKPVDYAQLRKDAQTTLRASVKEAEPVVRVAGTDALGKIKDAPSVPALTELTQNDPDAEVRGHAAGALAAIGARAIATALAKLEASASPPLKVWYASALAQLGDKHAHERLLEYARSKDLAVSFKAALALADVSPPGDKPAIAALRTIAARESELNAIVPFAGAAILTKLAALHDPDARKLLVATLGAADENTRVAAADALARLGDDAGRKVLVEVAGNTASPNQLAAGIALIRLGDYSAYEMLSTKLAAKEPDARRLAARGLGEIGERKSVIALAALGGDGDWTVRIAGAVAVIAIVGLDPQVLAQASVEWTKSALASDDWAVRKQAAGVLGDMPEASAVPLLASAIADKDANVRVAAARSARKMKSTAAVQQVAAAAKTEKDVKVKEEQVRALGAMGNGAARDTLVAIAAEPGRVGVFAAGALIAVGDEAGKAKLEAAVVDANVELRLAAVQSASEAKNPIVVATLKTGVGDKVFDVRFTAAEGLTLFSVEKALAAPVLRDGLVSKDLGLVARAETALLRIGEKLGDKAPTPAEMLDSSDPKVRLAAIVAIAELPASEAAPLIRRASADSDADVRGAAVDAIARLVDKDKDLAIKLYKHVRDSDDAVVRSKAQGQLSKLVEPPPAPAPAPQPLPTAPIDPAPVPPDAAAVDDTLPKVKSAADDAAAARGDAKTAGDAVDTAAANVKATTAHAAKDDDAIKRMEQVGNDVLATAQKAEDAAARADAAAKAAADAAGAQPSADAAKLVADAKADADAARKIAKTARTNADAAAKAAHEWSKAETQDPGMFVAAADAAIATGNYGEAKRNLDKAAQLFRASGHKNAAIDYSYGQLYDKMAAREKDPQAKTKLMQQALQYYEAFAKSGTGSRVKRANDRAAEIAEELKQP